MALAESGMGAIGVATVGGTLAPCTRSESFSISAVSEGPTLPGCRLVRRLNAVRAALNNSRSSFFTIDTGAIWGAEAGAVARVVVWDDGGGGTIGRWGGGVDAVGAAERAAA